MKHTKLTTLLAALAFGALAGTTQAQVLFEDDFESGNLNKWTVTGSQSPLVIQTGTNAVPGGGNFAAEMDISSDRMHANLVGGGTNSSKFTSYIYDGIPGAVNPADGKPSLATRIYNEVRNYAGGSFGDGALSQLLAIGKYNNISMPGEVYSGAHYQARITFGADPNQVGWFNLNAPGVPTRSSGWHKFDIEVGRNTDGTQTIRFYVDDKLGREFTGVFPIVPWNVVVLGPGLGSWHGYALIDGMKVVSGQPYIAQAPADQTINVDQTLTISAEVTGTGPLTYQWKKDGVNIPGATNVPLVINNAQTSDSGNYSLVAQNSLGSATSPEGVITVNPLITIAKDPATITINNGENVTFSVVSDITGNSPAVYQWRKDGVNIPGATGTSYSISNIQVADTAGYSVWDGTAISSASNVEQLNVNAAPVINAQNRTVAPSATFRYVLPVTDDYSVQGVPFETFDAVQSGATRVMFNNPFFSGSTTNNITTNNFYPLGVVTNGIPAGNGSSNAFLAKLEYSQDSSWPWVRLTTFGVTNRLNPVVSFTQPLRFDIYTDRDLGVAIGLRETGTANEIGANGGSSGSIEFLGASDNAPTPNLYVVPFEWTTVEFNPTNDSVAPYPGSGDGVLASNTGKGVLEHISLVWGDFAQFGFDYNIYFDNFVVVPTNGLTFSLDSGPTGAKIDSVTGAITWPASSTLGASETFFVRVTDSLGLDSTTSFTVTVSEEVPEPGALSITKDGSGNVIITWEGSFTLQSTATIDGTWADTAITSGQAISPSGSAFYRLRN